MPSWIEHFHNVQDDIFPIKKGNMILKHFPRDYLGIKNVSIHRPAWDQGVACIKVAVRPRVRRHILITHGNCQQMYDLIPLARFFADKCDAAVYLVEYPGA